MNTLPCRCRFNYLTLDVPKLAAWFFLCEVKIQKNGDGARIDVLSFFSNLRHTFMIRGFEWMNNIFYRNISFLRSPAPRTRRTARATWRPPRRASHGLSWRWTSCFASWWRNATGRYARGTTRRYAGWTARKYTRWTTCRNTRWNARRTSGKHAKWASRKHAKWTTRKHARRTTRKYAKRSSRKHARWTSRKHARWTAKQWTADKHIRTWGSASKWTYKVNPSNSKNTL